MPVDPTKRSLPILLAFCMLLLPCSTSHADGLLRRIFSGTKSTAQSDCPGGVCPTNAPSPQNWTNNDGLSARQHVEQVYGVSTAGMSRSDIQQHQNDYHNTYGSGHPVRGAVNAVVSIPRAGVRAVANAMYGTPRSSSGGGSSGSATRSYGSSGSAVQSYSSTGSLAVGQPDKFGHIVTEIYPPTPVAEVSAPYPVGPSTASSPEAKQVAGGPLDNLRPRRSFKRNVLAAAQQKVDDGSMSQEKYNELRFVLNIPRIAREMEDAMKTQAMEDGVVSGSLQDVDWEALMSFIVKWLPVILKLFAANDLQPTVINAAPFVAAPSTSTEWYTAA